VGGVTDQTEAFLKRHERLQAIKQLKPKNKHEAEQHANDEQGIVRCPDCSARFPHEVLDNMLYRCPKCGHLFNMPSDARLAMVFDGGEYQVLFDDVVGDDPIGFPGYGEKIETLRKKTGLSEAIVCALGEIGGVRTAAAVLDSRFLMGSMGVAVGERVCRLVELATEVSLPLVIFSASGGARMQEGIYSLMQMAKTAAAVRRHGEAGLRFIAVMTNPTTGGVTASFASLGDIIIAEPDALIGFAGPRVIEQTIGQKLPEGFQRSEYLLEHGFVDRIVERTDLAGELAKLIKLHEGAPASGMAAALGGASASGKTNASGELMRRMADERRGKRKDRQAKSVFQGIASVVGEQLGKMTQVSPSRRVELARDPRRPRADFFIDALFSGFLEMHGDRLDSDDKSIKAGIARFHGAPVTVIAQCKGSDAEQNIVYNFGMPNPQGYRKAQRLALQAEKFGRPVITIIDTPGAYPGIEAEEKGQGEAIARSIELFSGLKVPVVAVVIGEGGSGGALALGVANRVIMLENAVYSVLSPEGFASILWKDSSRSKEAARVMKLTSQDIMQAGVADAVVPEGSKPLVPPCTEVVERLDEAIADALSELAEMGSEQLVEQRYRKFRSIGTCDDGSDGKSGRRRGREGRR
jgi:acetyl-CoA carboxylase carboxyl transferase alpha subunit/acetyl-CoA carboxylase carboxyl transferase beta subunit